MQFRFRCAAVLTAVLLCSAAALPALAEETATPETPTVLPPTPVGKP